MTFPVEFFDMGAARFVHLRLHSEYSMTDGTVRIDDAVERAPGRRHAGARAHRCRQRVRPGQVLPRGARRRDQADRSAATSGSQQRDRSRQAASACCCCAPSAPAICGCASCCRAPGCSNQHRGRAEIAAELVRERHRRPDRAVRGRATATSARRCWPDNAAAAERLAQGWASAFPGRFYLEVQRAGHPQDEALRRAHRGPRRAARPAGGGDASGAVPRRRGFPRARGARVHRRRASPGRPAPAQPLHAGAVLQDAGGDGGAVRRHARRRSRTASRSRSAATWRSSSARAACRSSRRPTGVTIDELLSARGAKPGWSARFETLFPIQPSASNAALSRAARVRDPRPSCRWASPATS